jgi:uncharacterized protein YecE (DUF72 family)
LPHRGGRSIEKIQHQHIPFAHFFGLFFGMKFGKLDRVDAVDFRLPEDHVQTGAVLGRIGSGTQAPRIYLGATGWSNPEWVGRWYPPKTKSTDYLLHYSRQFGTIEFNTTHYRIPDPALVARWYAMAAKGFQFCPKVPQQISHYARLKAEAATTAFCSAIAGLGEKLGPTFLQLPDTHHPGDAASVMAFARAWPQELPLHWEFRHPDWYSGHRLAEATFELLAELGQGHVVTDVAGRRDVLHMRLTCPTLVLRFVGNHLHPSDYQRTNDWAARLREWTTQGLQAAYIFIHQPEMEEVPEFTQHWLQRIQAELGITALAPTLWSPPPPAQQSLF